MGGGGQAAGDPPTTVENDLAGHDEEESASCGKTCSGRTLSFYPAEQAQDSGTGLSRAEIEGQANTEGQIKPSVEQEEKAS